MNTRQAMTVRGSACAALLAITTTLSAQERGGGATPRPASLPKSGPVPREPHFEQKLQTELKAPPNFNLTLFAGPPIAGYPICLAEAGNGVVFVCVDPNLSLSQLKGVGRVMRLVDENNDGRADRYTTFAEMDSPRGIVFDGKTLYVMHPPMLTAYRDDDGDGVAEVKQDLVTGLGFDLDFRGADHTTNNVEMGIDGWLYVAVGDYGFVRAVGTDGTQLQHRGGGVVRVRPDGTHLEMYATGTRNIFDLAIDPFLHLFSRDNTNDGEGWDIRLHYLAPGANMGYPNLFQNFPTEHFPSLADYGAGSGVGGLWIQDPAWPAGYNNTLFTGDWTLQKIFRHPLAPKGASYAVQQEEFMSVARPSDFILDDRSNLYVASLSGGEFTYSGDTVGYVVRVNYTGSAPAAPPPVAHSDAEWLTVLASPNAIHRGHAQRELLRRGHGASESDAIVRGLQSLIANTRASAEARVAAIFTLKQLVGSRANATLLQATTATNPRVRELALRALADRKDELAGVTPAPFVKALHDPDIFVRVQALVGLERLGGPARDAASAIVAMAGSDDQALSHLAIHALVALNARDAALRGVDVGPAAVRAGALRALAMIYDEATVTALLERLGRAKTATDRASLLHTLARLYNREGFWRGDWWTTRPVHNGPYFDPALWEESPRIRPALRQALVAATGEEVRSLVRDFVANQVLPRGAEAIVMAVASSGGAMKQREDVLDALVGSARLKPNAMSLLTALDGQSPMLHSGIAELLAGEATLSTSAIPLVRAAALDTNLAPRVRERALTALTRMDAPDVIVDVLARLNPRVGAPNLDSTAAPAATPAAPDPVETAWRRFVGAAGRRQELDYFIKLATTGEPAHRVLAYAVLVQAVRSARTPPPVRDKVQPVLDAAWSDRASASSLADAITIMRVENQYLERLRAYRASPKP